MERGCLASTTVDRSDRTARGFLVEHLCDALDSVALVRNLSVWRDRQDAWRHVVGRKRHVVFGSCLRVPIMGSDLDRLQPHAGLHLDTHDGLLGIELLRPDMAQVDSPSHARNRLNGAWRDRDLFGDDYLWLHDVSRQSCIRLSQTACRLEHGFFQSEPRALAASVSNC